MLLSTFCHMTSQSREKKLWDNGILDWDAYAVKFDKQCPLPGLNVEHMITESRAAYLRRDAHWFASRLPPHEYWRVATSFPEQAVFLDIETTGLSHYYDKITIVGYSIKDEYYIHISGQSPEHLLDILSKTPIIITFNGTLFDIKFLRNTFDNIHLPIYHIDLRYFAKRVGLTGGQKEIEGKIGFKRNGLSQEITGETAPILWHQYLHGDTNALSRLTEYNVNDIEGMKVIIDECISLYCKNKHLPSKIIPNRTFTRYRFQHNKSAPAFPVLIHSNPQPACTYANLAETGLLNGVKIAGIDLVSSEGRESGVCILDGYKAETMRIKSDDEIIRLIREENVALVSIDSPLGIPAGRNSVFDDDPARHEFGIIRKCERVLASRGVRSYPCLIPSMQKLTRRGMLLASKLRQLGTPVIESFPGGAQDILNIPRKQAGIKYLTEGLQDFGLTGSFTNTTVSHDELDAITCSVAGLFFWTGKFEAVGDPKESCIIVPDLKTDGEQWLSRIILGLSGKSGAGKTTIATRLCENGFEIKSSSAALNKLMNKDETFAEKSQLRKLGWELHEMGQQRELMIATMDSSASQRVVLDSLRFPEDRATLQEMYGPRFWLIHIECSDEERKKRLARRDGFASVENGNYPADRAINQLSIYADKIIMNEGHSADCLRASREIMGWVNAFNSRDWRPVRV